MSKSILKVLNVLIFFALMFVAARLWAADTYQIDPNHSSLGFAIKHLTVSTVKGEFTDYSGTIQFDLNDLASFMADITIKATSVDTHQEKRDEHLRTTDFFEVEKYPDISFKSNKLTAQGDGYNITGSLNFHGVTKEITIPVKISGPVTSPMGGNVIGLSGETIINRKDYGMNYNKTLDTGGLILSDAVKVSIELEASHK